MSTETTTSGLTKLDIQALKQASRVAFHLSKGQSSIVGIKEVANPGPYDERDRRHEILCKTEMRDYRHGAYGNGERTPLESYSCFELVHGGQYDECWRTVVDSLRVGDELKLQWVADGGNQYTKEVGLHLDMLRLMARRANGKWLAWLIDVSICPNNSARMIRS